MNTFYNYIIGFVAAVIVIGMAAYSLGRTAKEQADA